MATGKGEKRKVTMVITQEVYDRLIQISEKESRSLSGQLVYIVNKFLEENKEL